MKIASKYLANARHQTSVRPGFIGEMTRPNTNSGVSRQKLASESTIARASIVVALQAIPVLASYDRGYASCEDGRRRREGKKEGTHFFLSHVEVPHLTVGPNVRGRCEPAHIGGCKFLRSTAQMCK